VREAFVRQFRNRRALGGYVGLGGTPFSSGGAEREQGIGKDGNRRVRAAVVVTDGVVPEGAKLKAA
jgi:transposase